jgi:group I intron endonuclease
MKNTKGGGIYRIVNTANGKTYIGKTAVFSRRWNDHQSTLRRGQHCNNALQEDWYRYGKDCFTFSVVEPLDITDDEYAAMREQYHTNAIDDANRYSTAMRLKRSYTYANAVPSFMGCA